MVLVPFALGHALLLTRINNPLRAMWSGDEATLKSMEVGAGDLAWALWACSRPATRAMDSMSGWRMRWQIRRIAARVQAHGIMATMVGFSNYLAEGFTGPKLRKATSDAQPCGAPLIAMLKAGLVAHFGKTDEEALNTPWRWPCGIAPRTSKSKASSSFGRRRMRNSWNGPANSPPTPNALLQCLRTGTRERAEGARIRG